MSDRMDIKVAFDEGYISKGLTEKVFPKALHLDIAKDGFKAGAEWQKAKDAKEIQKLKEQIDIYIDSLTRMNHSHACKLENNVWVYCTPDCPYLWAKHAFEKAEDIESKFLPKREENDE